MLQNYFKKKSLAFTLAEVLVTLGIIGVVSAMTVPSLMKNHQRSVYVTQLHKVYNEIQQATSLQLQERNAINLVESGIRSQATMATFINSRLKVSTCTSPSNCFASEYKNMDGAAVTSYSNTNASCFTMASGAAICLEYKAPVTADSCKASEDDKFMQEVGACDNLNMVGTLIVDSNGKSGPNVLGRDLFVMGLYNDGSVNTQNETDRTVCMAGSKCEEDKKAEAAKSEIQKCQSATSMAGASKAAYCFQALLKNNWQMDW